MKSYYAGPIGTHQRSFERYHPRCPTATLPQDWGSQHQPKRNHYLRSGRTGKATDCKFGRYIHRVHPKKPIKIWEKRELGRIPRTAQIFWLSPIISGMNFKFCTHIHRIDRYKSPWKISAYVFVGVLRDSRKFSGHPYIGRIARSSLR